MEKTRFNTLSDPPGHGRRQRLWAVLCMTAGVVCLISLADALISARRTPANHVNLLAGQSVELSGAVTGTARTARDLSVETDTDDLSLVFEDTLFKGFWFGTQMWHGRLSARDRIPAGTYALTIISRDLSGIGPKDHDRAAALSAYSVQVHGSARALRQSRLSLIRKYAGISPWLPALGAFLTAVLLGGAVYTASCKMEAQMALQGRAEIYRTRETPDGTQIFFGLGRRHGLKPGQPLSLLDKSGNVLAVTAVDSPGEENSSAVAGISDIPPGCLVAMAGPKKMTPPPAVDGKTGKAAGF